MLNEVNKIVIVGGGSAGWMTASFLIKLFPKKDITLIESPDVPTVGVGESTLSGINEFMIFLGIEEKQFMLKTNASYKLSIKFTDFYDKDSGSFHYPFGYPYLEGTVTGSVNDWMLKKSLYPKTEISDFVESFFPASALFNNNKYSENLDGCFDNFTPRLHAAYHFDASAFGEWLKTDYCLPLGVKNIVSEVVDIKVNKDGIDRLILKNKKEITSDLFIDCTGFKSLLLGEALKEPFISFSDLIPNNKAWATKIPYIEKERELEGFTNCTAEDNGWVWNIPLWSRLGKGYVYSDRYISSEEALEEFKQHLKSSKMVVPRTDKQVESLKFNQINMRIGIHERTFVKNVVAIGMAAGFIEPLESNGLFSVHTFLFSLGKALLRGRVNQWSVDNYNHHTFNIFKGLAEFVSLHYSLSIRQDTDYWKDVTERSYLTRLNSDSRFSEFSRLSDAKNYGNLSNLDGSIYITIGMNYPILDFLSQKNLEILNNFDCSEMVSTISLNNEKNKNKWSIAAKNSPTLYKYLKENIYFSDDS